MGDGGRSGVGTEARPTRAKVEHRSRPPRLGGEQRPGGKPRSGDRGSELHPRSPGSQARRDGWRLQTHVPSESRVQHLGAGVGLQAVADSGSRGESGVAQRPGSTEKTSTQSAGSSVVQEQIPQTSQSQGEQQASVSQRGRLPEGMKIYDGAGEYEGVPLATVNKVLGSSIDDRVQDRFLRTLDDVSNERTIKFDDPQKKADKIALLAQAAEQSGVPRGEVVANLQRLGIEPTTVYPDWRPGQAPQGGEANTTARSADVAQQARPDTSAANPTGRTPDTTTTTTADGTAVDATAQAAQEAETSTTDANTSSADNTAEKIKAVQDRLQKGVDIPGGGRLQVDASKPQDAAQAFAGIIKSVTGDNAGPPELAQAAYLVNMAEIAGISPAMVRAQLPESFDNAIAIGLPRDRVENPPPLNPEQQIDMQREALEKRADLMKRVLNLPRSEALPNPAALLPIADLREEASGILERGIASIGNPRTRAVIQDRVQNMIQLVPADQLGRLVVQETIELAGIDKDKARLLGQIQARARFKARHLLRPGDEWRARRADIIAQEQLRALMANKTELDDMKKHYRELPLILKILLFVGGIAFSTGWQTTAGQLQDLSQGNV